MPVINHFLLVGDNEGDALLLRRCFTRSRLTNEVETVTSGEAAIEYLSHRWRYAKLPSIIFLDLQLPGISGFEVLKWIRARPELASTRVVVVTGSDKMEDVSQAYELGASSFLIKPVGFEWFTEFSQALGGYWSWCNSAENARLPDTGITTLRGADATAVNLQGQEVVVTSP